MQEGLCREAGCLIQQLMEWYFSGEQEKIEEMEKYLSENIVVIGTGKHEYYNNRRDFLEGLRRDRMENDGSNFIIDKQWFEADRIGGFVWMVYGGFVAREKETAGRQIIVSMDTRVTALIHQEPDGRLLIDSIHHSIPYVYQREGEYYPKTFAGQAEEAIRRRKILEKDIQLDSMTGLYNRKYMEIHIREMLEKKQTKGILLLLDLDEFKEVNDRFGHQEGDWLLRHVSDLLKEKSGASDIVGRAGGDEFMLFLTGIRKREEAEQTAKEIIGEIGRFYRKMNLEKSCSIGIADLLEEVTTFEEAYSRADKALYRAKRRGKGMMCWY